MDSHLRTMEHFLEAGAEIMQAYLGAPSARRRASTRGRPLLGTVVAFEPGGELVARREFDPAEDRYLLDHTLGRTVSRTDPGLHALALMPLAMSLEILAEAAAHLVPGRIVTGMRDVRAHRWLAWEDAPQTLELRARRLDAHARARSRSRRAPHGRGRRDGGEPGGRGGRPARRRVRGAAPADRPGPQRAGGRRGFEPGRLYDEAMFHR